ncbi:EAL domain-containing protein [Sulfurimonas sp.]
MKNINILFTSLNELNDNAELEKLKDKNSLLIQLFIENVKIEYINSVLEYFREKFPLAILIGSSTDGIINNSTVYVNNKNLASFSYFEKTTLKSTIIKHENIHVNSFITGQKLAKALLEKDTKLLISFADGIHTNGEEYLNGISSINEDIILAGGLAADNGELVKTYVFTKECITNNGAVGVSLNGSNLHIKTNYTFDWKPIGKVLTVTKSVKNRVYEIDGIPTIELYAKYMGRELANSLPQIGVEFPLVLEKNGVFVGRAPLAAHKDGSLTFAGNINEGTKVRFGVGNINLILRNGDYKIRKMFADLKYECEAIFVYSCMARRRFMQTCIADELKLLSKIGNTAGFFTYGEFFHSQKKNQLLNQTMTILLLSESDNESKIATENNVKLDFVNITPEHVLAHLTNVVSNELAELNDNLEKKIKENAVFIYNQAYFDKLTGLANRLKLIEDIRGAVGKILFLVNIDDFTIINDFYGHDIADRVLVKLAQLLKKYAKTHKMYVYKLPSDEFAIIVDSKHDENNIKDVIRDILALIKYEEFKIDKNEIYVSVTIAAAFINKEGSGLINSDMALKLAKRAGKNFMIFNEDLKLSQQYAQNINISKSLKYALENDKIVPYFQPIYNVKTMKIIKYESLVRLIKEDGSVLSPYFFLEISQKLKLYPKITHIMIEKTFAYFSKNGLNFSLNLSFSDILNENTCKYIFSKIVEYKIAEQLTFEILETQAIDDNNIMVDFIDKVYSLGANIAIDDFGSGYANFEHMTKIRSDYMKIDGSLIKNIDKDNDAKLVVETIIMFAKKLHKKTVAEFVHSKEVFDIVKEMGVDCVQGYYFAEPQPEIISPK